MNDIGHYPYQVGIDAYGKGGFRFADMSHRGSLLCLPTGMHEWPVENTAQLSLSSLDPVLALSEQVDVLLIGLGGDITALGPDIRAALRDKKIIVEAVATGGAVRTYNILLGEKRAVAAALIAVDTVR
ncbi:MTH938/NDUFAF3 family protein [Devosia rhodophyticola]|uniref:MTH938/NDUFAF3 family protein n=1 Tax=Devosia rhodophyticola TaxID=3026423 RepID=A0ABY7YWJ7_9HYPH|nr:MTH938/NDUFAF3 family protein [Devosia rhodophyticola]WDR05765.1 MTH938/NDUFAF3 family protein [Devosia rhodophyticola]